MSEMSLHEILATYGYPALLLGTLLEGETIVVVAGYLARRGYLDLHSVIWISFLGTFAADQTLFHLGRSRGSWLLDRVPTWRPRVERALGLLRRYETPLIVGFRFVYGMRTVTPFAIGASGVNSGKFFVLNGLGGMVWAIAIASLGYLFGYVLESVLSGLQRYEAGLLLLVVAASFLAWVLRALWRRRHLLPGGAPGPPPPGP